MKKKWNKQDGFTMVEMMVTVVLVLLFAEIMALGIDFATSTYTDSVAGSEVQVLKAHLTTAINNELRFAEGMDEKDGPVSFVGGKGNEKNFLINEDGELSFDLVSNTNLTDKPQKDEETGEEIPPRNLLVSGDSYPEGVTVETCAIKYETIKTLEGNPITSNATGTTRGIFTVTLELKDGDGVIASSIFQVKNHAGQVNNDADDT